LAALQKKNSEKRHEQLWSQASLSAVEAFRTVEIRQREAEAARTELEVRKLAGEVARQPLEEELLEVQIEEGLAEIARSGSEVKSLDAARFRGDVLLVVSLLMIILILSLAMVNPKLLEAIGGALPGLPS
jgi:hypothetical protein